MSLTWKKCPSVTTGGKPFFWIARPTEIPSPVLSVVWGRFQQKWSAQIDGKQVGLFETPEAAKQYFEREEKIKQGKIWRVYPDADPDNILFEGSRSACLKFLKTQSNRAELRFGKLLWENL